MVIHQRNSPNWNARPLGMPVSAIILHADAAKKLTSSLGWILQRESRVSYHYLIGRAGHVYQCVPPDTRAWHAGVSAFQGVPDCNNYAVGVSFSNDMAGEPYSDVAIEAGARVCASLMQQFPAITLDRITTHQAVALPPGRKHDPGPLFPLTFFLSRVQTWLAGDATLPPAA